MREKKKRGFCLKLGEPIQKNEETNLSPYELADNYYWPKNLLIKRKLEEFNSLSKKYKEAFDEQRDSCNMDVESYANFLIEKDQQGELLYSLNSINSGDELEKDVGFVKTCILI